MEFSSDSQVPSEENVQEIKCNSYKWLEWIVFEKFGFYFFK